MFWINYFSIECNLFVCLYTQWLMSLILLALVVKVLKVISRPNKVHLIVELEICFIQHFLKLYDKESWNKVLQPISHFHFSTVHSSFIALCTSFFQKIRPSTIIPTSMFIDFATFALPPRLFQPPRLLERWEYKSALRVWLF